MTAPSVGLRKHMRPIAETAFPYAVSTSSRVSICDVPFVPYSDSAPYPFRTLVCARQVSWYSIICDRDSPPPEAIVSNMEPRSERSGSA